ncbi:UDP-glucose 4-epimerase [Fictibacillus macauensis ZFHKF-1]|uniref:UDP-glucose 4-epimerase n=1 Tax=Fictibacillus macauensis ZFHKF-1 TaxID=1196324 RepID=I8UCE2_9BACL|nr:NAD-dependent epimerase/dehydratase family protein [Fictibacillus macauensis]EIT84580.1 UDP-glucose 4-epimerase [Fictibacillus macauensis ZFHKF-1]
MNRVLVTGAAGFIGAKLCTRLVEEDVDVIGIDSASCLDALDFIGRNANFQLINEPIEEVDLTKIVKDRDTIFHLACSTSHNEAWGNIEQHVKRHIHRLKQLTHSMERNKSKLIHVSSYEVYGRKTGTVSEASSANPQSLYGLVKLTEENFIKATAADDPLSYMILRMPIVYGPGQSIESLGTEDCVSSIERQSSCQDALYIDDAVKALLISGASREREGIYNIGSGREGEWQKGLKFLAVKNEPSSVMKTRVLADKAREELGFQQEVAIEEGLKKQKDARQKRRKKK